MLERKAKKTKTNYILIFEVYAECIKPEKNRRLAVAVFSVIIYTFTYFTFFAVCFLNVYLLLSSVFFVSLHLFDCLLAHCEYTNVSENCNFFY